MLLIEICRLEELLISDSQISKFVIFLKHVSPIKNFLIKKEIKECQISQQILRTCFVHSPHTLHMLLFFYDLQKFILKSHSSLHPKPFVFYLFQSLEQHCQHNTLLTQTFCHQLCNCNLVLQCFTQQIQSLGHIAYVFNNWEYALHCNPLINKIGKISHLDLILCNNLLVDASMKRDKYLLKLHPYFKKNTTNKLGISSSLKINQFGFLLRFLIHSNVKIQSLNINLQLSEKILSDNNCSRKIKISQTLGLKIYYLCQFNQVPAKMPLYQMMIIAKCSTPENLAQTSVTLAKQIWKHGGVVRDVKILTDRILTKQLKSKDGQYATLGRFCQVLFDGSPIVMDKARKAADYDKNILKVSFFKIEDFYMYAQEYQKSVGSQIETGSKKIETARKIAALRDENSL